MKLLNQSQLERLSRHEYKSEGRSILEPWCQIFWRWLITCCPMWLAPNLITFIGLLFNLAATLCVVFYDPNSIGQAPAWVFLAFAVTLFIYQSLDAIDGKQARRTQTNNQLGELFDHGCDALSNFLLIPGYGSAVAMNEHPRLFMMMIAVQLTLYYCYHWQSYVSGILRFNRIDVTEAQLLVIAIELASYACGVDIWRTVVVGDFDLRQALLYGSLLCGMGTVCTCLVTIFRDGQGKNGSTVADTSVLSPAIPLLLLLVSMMTYSHWSPLNRTHLILFLTVFGIPLVKISIVMVVSCLTKSAMPLVDISMLAPLVAFGNLYFGIVVPEVWLFCVLSILVLADLVVACTLYCWEIADHLNVHIFRIPMKQTNQ